MSVKEFIESFRDRIVSSEEILGSLDRAVIFGAGGEGRLVKRYLEAKNKEVLFFCDNDPLKHGTFVDSLEVMAPEELLNQEYAVCIASDWARDIALQLKGMGVEDYLDLSRSADTPDEQDEPFRVKGLTAHFAAGPVLKNLAGIEDVYNLFEDDESKKTLLSILRYRLTLDPASLEVAPFEEYYNPHVGPEKGDVIIDAGAWTGDTAVSFARHLDSRCRIFSFEPAKRNYEVLLKNIEERGLGSVVTPVMAGLWNVNSRSFMNTDGYSWRLHVDSRGNEEIGLTALDDFLGSRGLGADLIKMDIEGAEAEAIAGARETISKQSPRLQISVYHKVNDLWEIPLLIKEINPGYRFYLSHHSQGLVGTVLYAGVNTC